MKFHLLSKKECDNIVEQTETFYKADKVVEGQNVVLYDYRLASTSDFENFNAWELRGLCFVEQSDGTWKRNILLNKFFNINQTKGTETSWLEEDLQDKKIVSVANKEDGSIISFVLFENGKIRAKSKMSFDSEQAQMAQKCLDESAILFEEIHKLLKKNITPVFELVGYENQIVLNYDFPYQLRLLQVRNEDGTYVSSQKLQDYSIPMGVNLAQQYDLNKIEKIVSNYSIDTAKEILSDKKFKTLQDMIDFFTDIKQTGNMTILDFLLLSREYIEDEEGEVISFEDSQMAKIKNQKYLQLHGLIGPDAFRENLLIQTIIEGNIDDVISSLIEGQKKEQIKEIENKVTIKFNHLVTNFLSLRSSYFNEFNENRKEFAMVSKNEPMFSSVMKSLNLGKDLDNVEKIAESAVKEHILKVANTLGKAKEWIYK